MATLSFVFVCHLRRAISSLTSSGSVMLHCLSRFFSLCTWVAIVPSALPFFFMFHAWLRMSPKFGTLFVCSYPALSKGGR